MRTNYFLASILIGGAAMLAACTLQPIDGSKDSNGDGGADGGAAPLPDAGSADAAGSELHECEVYAPATVEGIKEGAFTGPDDVQTATIDVNDPGGGLVTVVVDKFGEAGAVIEMGHKEASGGGASDSSAVTTNPKLVYRVGGGESYTINIKPLHAYNATGSDYKFSWSYEPLIDCYEKNDDKVSAKRIPIDTDITAHGHAGVRASMSTLITSGTDDWYRFVLDEPTTVRLVTNHPRPIVEFLLIDANDKTLIRQARTSEEAVQASNSAQLEPGEYFVHYESTTSLEAAMGGEGEVPPHWTQPYTLRVETVTDAGGE